MSKSEPIGGTMNVKPLLAALALALVGAGWFAGAGASAGYRQHTPAVSAQAAAAPQKPELEAWTAKPSLGAASPTELALSFPSTGPEAGKATVYMPAGYTLNLAAQPGTVEGHVLLATASELALGNLKVVNPANYDNSPAAQACAPGGHVAVWIMNFKAGIFSSQTMTIPIYIDPTSGDETALGAYKLQACLPLANVASPGGWPIGSRLQVVAVEFNHMSNPTTAADYVWRAFISNPDVNGNPDPTTTYELRSDLPLPAKLTVSARYVGKHRRSVLSGRLTTPSAPVGGVTVTLYNLSGLFPRPVASTQTQSDGTYRFAPIARTGWYGTEATSLGDCSAASTAPNGCVDETLAAIDSPSIRVVIHKHR
jgi:hypothetical protein